MALLIDGDNAQACLIGEMLAETARHGAIIVRRIYGDWTTPQMAKWKETIHAHAIRPQQQFPHTCRKNATDSALIIDALDLLHRGTVRGFCIVSTDSDFTSLAIRIREEGLFVMGIGRPETPKSFVQACEVFVHTTDLAPKNEEPEKAVPKEDNKEKKKAPKKEPEPSWIPAVRNAIMAAPRKDGWADLGTVGHYVHKNHPAFDPQAFGYKTFSNLVASRPNLFKTRNHKPKNKSATQIRLKS